MKGTLIKLIIIACIFLSGCVSSSEIYDGYSRGGHPVGKSKYKGKWLKQMNLE